MLDRPQRPEAGGELNHANSTLLQGIANVPIEHNVGAAEFVDRLLGIAYYKELSWRGRHVQPIRFGWIVGGEQQQDFSLQGVGVLKLVDEDVGEAVLQVTP